MNSNFFTSHSASENLNAERESYNNFLQQFLNSPSGSQTNASNESTGCEFEPQHYSKTSSGHLLKSTQNMNIYSQNSEYETITT